MNIQCTLTLTLPCSPKTHPAERPADSELVFARGSRLCKQIAVEGSEAPSGREERRVAGGAARLLLGSAMVRCRAEVAAAARHAAHQPPDRHDLLLQIHKPACRCRVQPRSSPTTAQLCTGTWTPRDSSCTCEYKQY